MVCAVFEVGNFAYVLPNYQEAPTDLVIQSPLQMGWALPPCFLHVMLETSRNVAESYSHGHVRTLTDHPFEGSKISELLGLETEIMWGTNECNKFLTLLEE